MKKNILLKFRNSPAVWLRNILLPFTGDGGKTNSGGQNLETKPENSSHPSFPTFILSKKIYVILSLPYINPRQESSCHPLSPTFLHCKKIPVTLSLLLSS